MLSLLIIFGMSAVFYRLGFRFMIKSKILNKGYNELYSYIFFMFSGVSLGEYISIELIPYFFQISTNELILITTTVSILMGEAIYYRNLKLMSHIVTSINKE